jgi:hypothetical protein
MNCHPSLRKGTLDHATGVSQSPKAFQATIVTFSLALSDRAPSQLWRSERGIDVRVQNGDRRSALRRRPPAWGSFASRTRTDLREQNRRCRNEFFRTSTRQSSQLKVRERDTVAGLVGDGIIGFRCDLPSSKFMEGQNKRMPRRRVTAGDADRGGRDRDSAYDQFRCPRIPSAI